MKLFLRFLYFHSYLILLLIHNVHAQSTFDNDFALKFIGEQIIESDVIIENTLVGGLSSIDFINGTFYAVCDDSKNPRFYELDLKFNDSLFTNIRVSKVHHLLTNNGNHFEKSKIDPEGLRFDSSSNNFIWVSEGNINKNIAPQLFETNAKTFYSESINLPYSITNLKTLDHNGTLEAFALSSDNKGYWLGMESPLKSDGDTPTFSTNDSPIRITYIDKELKKATLQYAYILDKVAKKPKNKTSKSNNGLVEILALDNNRFLTLERSFTIGKQNVIKLFIVSVEETTDILNISSLNNTKFTHLKKELLLNFNSIKNQLPSNTIDNIEGMCFGPQLKDGSQTLIFISDNNLNKYGNQITQIIAFSLK